jgi:hypothetical protein
MRHWTEQQFLVEMADFLVFESMDVEPAMRGDNAGLGLQRSRASESSSTAGSSSGSGGSSSSSRGNRSSWPAPEPTEAEVNGNVGQLEDAAWELLMWAWEQCGGPEPVGHAGSSSSSSSSAARSACKAGQLYARCCLAVNTGGPAASNAVAQQRAVQLCKIASDVGASDVETAPLACLAVVCARQALPRSQLVAGGPVCWLAAVQRIVTYHRAHFVCHRLLWKKIVPDMFGLLLEASTLAAVCPAEDILQRSCAAAADACMTVLNPAHKVVVRCLQTE